MIGCYRIVARYRGILRWRWEAWMDYTFLGSGHAFTETGARRKAARLIGDLSATYTREAS